MVLVFQQAEAQLAAQAAASPAVAAAIGSADPYPPGQWGPSNAATSGLTQTQWEHRIMLLRMALESAEALRLSAQGDFKKEHPPRVQREQLRGQGFLAQKHSRTVAQSAAALRPEHWSHFCIPFIFLC